MATVSPAQTEINSVLALYSNGQIQEALVAVGALIKSYPNDPFLYSISGACFVGVGQLDTALKSYEKALAIKPDYAEVHYNLGVTLQELGQLDAAVKSYEKALAIKPDYADAHNNLGNIFLELNELNLAIDHFEWAVAYSPNYAEAYNNLGAVFQELNQFDKAIEQYKKAIIINPEYAQAFNNLGCSCEILGFKDEALIHYEKAITCNPKFAEAYRNLSNIKKFTEKDPQIGQMQSLNSSSDVSLSEKVQLNFALAKVNENLGNNDKFFKFLNEGNRLRKQELNYSFTESKNLDNSTISKQILKEALQSPINQIVINAGKNPEDVIGQGLVAGNYGYDVKRGVYGDMYDMGIIDPLKVTRSALQNAVSVAVTLLSTNAIVTMARTYEDK